MRRVLLVLLGVATMAASGPDGFDLQGHRGARGLLPENTIPAFLKAVELGVTTVELDVVVTRDLRLVASHEPWFDHRICSTPEGAPVRAEDRERYRIYALSYDEVARFDCGRRRHPLFPRQQPMPVAKPLLRDAIHAVEAYVRERGLRPVHYNIETKMRSEPEVEWTPPAAEFARLLHDELRELGVLERSIVQSFDVRTLQATRALDASVRLALLVHNDLGLEPNLERLGFVPQIYSPDFRLVDEALVREAHRRGMRVIPWTVNGREEMERLRALGVDGLITDYPDVGRELLR